MMHFKSYIKKKNLLAALTIVILSTLCLLAVFWGVAPLSARAGETGESSGSIIDYSKNGYTHEITLDMNGKTGVKEDYSTSMPEGFRQRTITVSSLFNTLKNKPTDGDYKLYDKSKENAGDKDKTPKNIYNYSQNYFSVSGVTSSTVEYEEIVITAKGTTNALDSDSLPRFVLILENPSANYKTVTLTIKVRVTSLSPYETNQPEPALWLGSRIDSQNSEIDDDPNTKLPITLTNYSIKEINLEDYFVGRKLYTVDPKKINRKGLSLKDEKKLGVLYDNETERTYRTFNDLNGFTLRAENKPEVSVISEDDIKFFETTATDDNPINRSFTITVDFTESETKFTGNLSIYNNKFWSGEGAYFELPVTIYDTVNGKDVTVHIPVEFAPAETPSQRAKFSMETELNGGSVDIFTENESSTSGFKQVRVRPEYLCDFAYYYNNPDIAVKGMWFDDENVGKDKTNMPDIKLPTINYNKVDIVAAKDERGVYFDITARDNGSIDLEFTVHYANNRNRPTIRVPVTFVVYGAYNDIRFDIRGSKTAKFTINSDNLSNLKDDGYQIVSAKISKRDSSDTNDYASVSCTNGVISVRPERSILDYDTVGISVTLVDMEGHRIELDCGMQINMKVGFGSTWETWQWILFWVGIGLGAALLLLFVIWLFLRSLHKRKLDELETSAPTSAYIIKLNSTIAAAQAQQKLATQGFANPQGQMLQLGAGPTSTPAAAPGTLALGATPQMSTPIYSSGTMAPPPPPPMGDYSSTTTMTPPPVQTEEIYIPISDEELLIRIYEEKFAPRGMLKRTFDKSKDLQQRELEKEKERIREDVRNGMSIEEACKSLKERETATASGLTFTDTPLTSEPVVQTDPLIAVLGFDPNEPIVTDITKEEPSEDWGEAEKAFKEAEYNNRRLHAEMAVIESRIESIVSATEKTENEVNENSAAVEELNAGIKESSQRLDDKNTDLAIERRKSAKEALSKEIAELEAKIKSDKDTVAVKRANIDSGAALLMRIKEVSDDYNGKKEATEALVASSDQELEAARAEAQRAAELAAKAKKQAELNAQLEVLNPMMLTVNTLNGEINDLTAFVERSGSDKDSLKTRVGALQNELLSTTDASKIGVLSEEIKSLNKEISNLDRSVTSNTKLKSDKSIEMSSVRRKANEFIDKESIELEDVIAAEDRIIGQIAMDKLRASTEEEKATAEAEVARIQAELDSLIGNLDVNVAEAAAQFAERVKALEEKLAEAQGKLAQVNETIEKCENDDEKLSLTMEQMSLEEEVNNFSAAVETLRAEGIKANLESKMKGEKEIENARAELEKAKEEFEKLTERYNDISININPLDLITSGSGVISQDRKKIEAENYKKKLEESQNAIEQAKLQAQLAQQEAEKAVADAQRASAESKAEAERMAQEALEKAEAARLEAEQKAQEEAERVRREAEEVKRLAQEEAERARLEAEEARKSVEDEAERLRREAEEEKERLRKEMEEAKLLAEEEAEKARKEAEEAAEKARLEAEEAAEKARLEAEEEKRKSEEEAEKARIAAEEEAKKQAEEDAKRKAIIDEKVAKRKTEITRLRDELKNITDEEQGNALREKFYQMQLALDEDEKTSTELIDLLNKAMDDASHAAELSRYKKLANQKPRRVVKKVTERVNRIPKRHPGQRPAVRSGASGVRAGAARPGAARPVSRSGARPGAARPAPRSGARPTSGGRRPPSGTRPRQK